MRILGFLLIVVLGLTAGAAATAGQEATPAAGEDATAARTNIRYFLPFTGDGLASGLTVTDSASGHCTVESLADFGRPDAWTCIDLDSGELYDPCFENPFGPIDEPGELACVSSPFSPEVVSFTLTEPIERIKDIPVADDGTESPPADDPGAADEAGADLLPAAEDDARDSAEVAIDPFDVPWALELANGERCTLLTGATAVLAGERINYGCEGGGLVLGEVNRGAAVWTVSYLADGAFATDLVEVTVAWT